MDANWSTPAGPAEDRAPRVRLAHLPTPLEPLQRLTARLGGPRLWIKRDDCTGLAGGGNKTRKLEFLLGDALAHGADVVLTAGAVQSNHARQTAAACARLGLPCELFLRDRVAGRAAAYETSGNVLLDRLLGAQLEHVAADADADAAVQERAEALRAGGRAPYAIPTGGSNPVGAAAYFECARELRDQAERLGFAPSAVVHASSSRGTQAGLAAGFAGSGTRVIGIDVDEPDPGASAEVAALAAATGARCGGAAQPAQVALEDRFGGAGYGIPSPDGLAALRLLARLEGILLDPVYTAKAMAGLIALVRERRFAAGDDVVFLHTGGSPALFAYADELDPQADPEELLL